MKLLSGVYIAKKKDGTTYYRSSITYSRKHISLGSFPTMKLAHKAYQEASDLLHSSLSILNFCPSHNVLSFEKWIVLNNFRDNHIYIGTPIYLKKTFLEYYFSPTYYLKFDLDDLFYYSSHKIMQRKGHLFVADYGMQVTITNRYGIKNYGVINKDYFFVNGDNTDYRYENIKILNSFHGVTKVIKNSQTVYQSKIHIHGNYLIGYYNSDIYAAIAYNKAIDILAKRGIKKNFTPNYIEDLKNREYAEIYSKIKISKKIVNYPINK